MFHLTLILNGIVSYSLRLTEGTRNKSGTISIVIEQFHNHYWYGTITFIGLF